MISDEELVRQMVDGDQNAFEMLVTRYHGPLLSYAAQRLGDREKAKDLVQETFIRLLRHLRTYEELENVRPWLYRVLINLCRDYWRSAGFRSVSMAEEEYEEYPDSSATAETLTEQKETVNEIAACLKGLPEPQGEIIRLRFFHDLKLQEISDLLGIPLSTVKSHLYGGLRKLKRIMERPPDRVIGLVGRRNKRTEKERQESEVKLHESSHR